MCLDPIAFGSEARQINKIVKKYTLAFAWDLHGEGGSIKVLDAEDEVIVEPRTGTWLAIGRKRSSRSQGSAYQYQRHDGRSGFEICWQTAPGLHNTIFRAEDSLFSCLPFLTDTYQTHTSHLIWLFMLCMDERERLKGI